jgi:hypothetical protein
MSKPLDEFVKIRYLEFSEAVVDNWGINKKELLKVGAEFKPIFKRYLSLGCAATLVGERKSRNEYVQGLIEAGQLCLVLGLKGLENACCVILRQSIELVLKHIYFSTHPVEYEWVTFHEGYRDLTFQKLLDFWTITPEYRALDPDRNVYALVNDWFGVLSRHVHVHSKRFIGYKQVNLGHRIDITGLRKLNDRTKEIWPLLTIILVSQFPKSFLNASVVERRLIRNFLPTKFRDRLDSYLYRSRTP